MSRPIECDELKRELFLEVLRSFGTSRFAATGSSMLPTVWPGDILEVCQEPALGLLPGQVAVFRRDDRLFAHRVVKQLRQGGKILLITRGDRLGMVDQPVCSDELLGRVTAIERRGRRLSPRATPFTQLVSWTLRHSEIATGLLLHINEWLRPTSAQRQPLPLCVGPPSITNLDPSQGVSA